MEFPSGAPSRQAVSAGAWMQPKKILIVDDSKVAAMTEELILRSLKGCEVITAEDGIKGVEKAVTEQPDLILMDVVMPRMNGFEACRLIRGHEATESIPIIMVTTRSESAHVEEGFASGCNDYIFKPIGAAELLEKIHKLADDRQQ
jgi:CheY-like chemotaxis protein